MAQWARGVAVAVAALSLGCTVYHTRHPLGGGAVGEADQVAHCLASAGLEDWSDREPHAGNIAADPTLVAVWAGPELRTYTASLVAVRRDRRGWHLMFLPRLSAAAAQVHAEAFARCVELHSPGTTVEVESEFRVGGVR